MILSATLAAGCSSEPEREGRPGGVLVALGDSVAAGHGLGDSRGFPSNPVTAFPSLVGDALEMDVYNFAISGACIATAALDAGAGRNCTRSILEDQLPAAKLVGRADLVVITIGANDILFAECFEAFIRNAPHNTDPCRGPRLEGHLAVITRNLPNVTRVVRESFGDDVRILLTQYYNPLPQPTDVVEHACDMWGPATLSRRPELVPLPKDSPTFRGAVLEVQKEAWSYGSEVVERLDATLQLVAEKEKLMTVRFDAKGHDPCTAIRGLSAAQTWIFGLSWSDGGSAPPPVGPPRYESRPMPGPCPDTSLDPADTEVRVGGAAQDAYFGYTIRVKVNCLAHPTIEGQQALAQQALAVLRAA